MSKVFVSHSHSDEAIVDLFVDDVLVKGLQLKCDEIFCTSVTGMGIRSGDDFVNSLKSHLIDCQVAILIISENYKASEVCLNEMGAVWALSKKVYPFIVEPMSFNQVGVVQRNNQISKLDSEDCLHNFRDAIVEALSLDKIPTGRWTTSVKKFIQHLSQAPRIKPELKIDRPVHQKLKMEYESLQKEYEEIDLLNDQLQKQVYALEATKDREQVQKIRKQFNDTDPLTEFEENIPEINKIIKKIRNSVVIRTVFAEFAKVEPKVDHSRISSDREEIDDAIRRKYLDQEDFSSTSKDPIPQLFKSLEALDDYPEDDEFMSAYEEKYKAEYDPRDQDFWDRHFKF